jgi:hypothetical protein
MPNAVGEFTTAGGGGGADLVAAAICTLASGRATATTIGPDGRLAAATVATTAMATSGNGVVGVGIRRAVPLTAHASTKGAIVATLNAGFRVKRMTRRRTVTGWSSLNLEMPKSERDLHTAAGSSACVLRR